MTPRQLFNSSPSIHYLTQIVRYKSKSESMIHFWLTCSFYSLGDQHQWLFIGESNGERRIPLREGKWCKVLLFACTICWTISWVACDLRRHDAHVISLQCDWSTTDVSYILWNGPSKWGNRTLADEIKCGTHYEVVLTFLPLWTERYVRLLSYSCKIPDNDTTYTGKYLYHL